VWGPKTEGGLNFTTQTLSIQALNIVWGPKTEGGLNFTTQTLQYLYRL